MANITLVEAVNQALMYEMTHDENVVVFGEDVAKNGGVFRTTVGLLEKFGPKRVLDTPLAESMIAGMAIGMAAQGLKPIAEFQFMGFIYPAVDHILNQASRLRNRTRGRLSCPAVFRAPYGGGIHAPEHHSESTETLFAHIPGLRVVIPSSPARAYGLLLAAIRNPDPVLFLEPKRIYRWVKQEVPDDGIALPLDKCFVLREGSDITLITWGAMIKETLEAAEALEQQGVSCEIIDVATLKPIDFETILQSVEKTGRCLIIHEAARHCGVGAEIAATVAEHGIFFLRAPIKRVTGYDTVMPYYKMEKYYLPSSAKIISTAQQLMEFA
ncbi:MAG: alpha-ketoacid dehydrogenase subunit beta [Pseudomonadota bacterium]